jgi:serine protease AprX
MNLFLKSTLKYSLIAFAFTSPILSAKAIVDSDVLHEIRLSSKLRATNSLSASNQSNSQSNSQSRDKSISLLLFLNENTNKAAFINILQQIPEVSIQDLGFMPAIAIQTKANMDILNQIADIKGIAQISQYKPGREELDITAQILKLAPSTYYPNVQNWWANGFTGKKGIIGLLDTGLDFTHPALAQKKLIIRQEEGSGYSDYTNGVKEPHGTGMACIYASNDGKYKGIAFDASTIVTALAGAETADTSSIMQTLSSLDWMLNRSHVTPTIINYSMGNGKLANQDCPEWSGLARVIDYVINTKKILWVKSAGNMGYIEPSYQYPFASTLTVPGDNYNGITVANMNADEIENSPASKTADRTKHRIKYTSSRGPTPFGRRKPDLTAPGHDTRTCAPDPTVYPFKYPSSMEYKDGYRWVGGTSSAAPHVGASALLLQDAGIKEPMAMKALLINSADTWTDAGTEDAGHKQIMGSLWNRTYGWGYINMEKAFKQRNNIIQEKLSLEKPILEYRIYLAPGDKVTLVHERRVGYTKDNPWKLSHVSLELIDLGKNKVIAKDDSPIDTVHQVANCRRQPNQSNCSIDDRIIRALVRVTLLGNTIDGSTSEPFALVTERRAIL